MKRIKIGIVGLGRVASKTHIPVLKSIGNVVVVSGADKNRERAQRVKEIFSIDNVYSDYEGMYESEDLDGVYICLPSFLHKDACVKALEKGLHVLCEKPMCMSAKEAEELTNLAKNKGLILMPGYKKRYGNNFEKARDLLSKGILGKVIQIQGIFITPGPYISWDPKSDWYLGDEWHGVIYDIGCHIIDLLLYLIPFEVRNVRSIVQRNFSGYNVPTNVSCVFEMENGAIGDITMGWRASTDIFSIALHGTAGSIIVSRDYINYLNPGTDPIDKIRVYLDNAFGEVRAVSKKIRDKIQGKDFYIEDLRQAEAFCKAVSGRKEPPLDGEDAVRVHRVLEQIIASQNLR